LPQWNRELAAEVKRRAEAMQKLPEGSSRRTAAANRAGEPCDAGDGGDVERSGLVVLVRECVERADDACSERGRERAAVGGELWFCARAAAKRRGGVDGKRCARGLAKGGVEAAQLMESGMVTGTRLMKVEAARPLELAEFARGWRRR
jgi:hypothetical protein